jgi:hypothetical protein
MTHKIDWESLAELQFLLYSRIADSLNAALSGIALSDMPEAQDKPPGYWQERATAKVSNVLNLFTAWSNLIRFKLDGTIPERALRPFAANALLAWLGTQLHLSPVPRLPDDPTLYANQETLQEALLLLYSAAFTQGSGVRLEVEPAGEEIGFRVRFERNAPIPATFDALLASFGDHWRDQDTLFELATARDFVALNGLALALNTAGEQCEFAFRVPSTAGARARLVAHTQPGGEASATTHVMRNDATPVIFEKIVARSDATPALPESPAPGDQSEPEPFPDPPVIPSPVAAPDAPAEPDAPGPTAITLQDDDTQPGTQTLVIRRPPGDQAQEDEAPPGAGAKTAG